jgi:hypothetical protein
MLKTEAKTILATVERRLRPARPPWHGEPEVLEDWADLLIRYDSDQVANAMTAHLEGGTGRWPNYYTFRDLLKRARSQAHHPSNASDCSTCTGTGWQAGNDMVVINRTYSTVIPCHCPAGQATERTELWTQAPGLCQACKGAGWFNHNADEVERCDNCAGSGIARP